MLTLDQAAHWYPHDDPVHGFEHVSRVYYLARYLAVQEGADIAVVSAAALLHDVQNPVLASESESSLRHNHQQAAADFAELILKNEGWPLDKIAAVQQAIRAHRFRDDHEQPETLEAKILFDADKLDAIGAIGVARAMAYAIQAGAPIFAEPSAHFRETGSLLPGEAHSAYHEYLYKLVRLIERMYTPSARCLAETRHQTMVTYFKQLGEEMQFARSDPWGGYDHLQSNSHQK